MDYTPKHYTVSITPDLQKLNFTGKSSVSLILSKPVNQISVHALDLEIDSVKLNGLELETSYDMKTMLLNCILPSEKEGEIKIEFDYTGKISDKLVGIYQSKYTIDGKEKMNVVSQFQESDCRRAFPCIDIPGVKATFDISMIVDGNLLAISNTSIMEEVDLGNGKKKVSFHTTPIMSTYLLFFAFGEFEGIEVMEGETKVSILASPGQAAKYGEFALDFAQKSLRYCEQYYAIDFPLPKLDNIATASFAHGAMENWGAILYRENLLLVYPGVTSQRRKTVIQMVIAHEIAHQWFGNLVSPNSWKYIWLNESFATFFGYSTIDHYYKEKNIWELFLQFETNGALSADAYICTTPIEIEGDVAVAMSIKSSPIIYNKGGSILRMLESYVGYESFRDGLRYYLKQHEYGTATSGDLWAAIGQSTGQDINSLMESWVLQAGHPIITPTREGNNLILTQHRFTYIPHQSDTKWEIPISITEYIDDQFLKTEFLLLKDQKISYTLDQRCTSYKLNTGLTGFYRVNYSEDNLNALKPLIEKKILPPIDRYNLVNERFAMLRGGRISLKNYLDLIPSYLNEDNYLSIAAISSELRFLSDLFDGENSIKTIGRQFTEAMLEKHGYEAKEGEAVDITSTRGSLMVNAVRFGSENVKEYTIKKYEEFKQGGEISADLLASILNIAAFTLNDRDFLLHKYENAENEQEGVTYLSVLGEFTNLDYLIEMQSYAFEKVPGRNRTTLINTILANPIARGTIWKYYLANLDNFEALHEYMYQTSLLSLIRYCVNEEEEVERFFKDYVKKHHGMKDAIDVGLELVRINKQILQNNV